MCFYLTVPFRNIAFGLDPLAVRKNAGSVVEIAQIKPFLDELPNGLDTLVGECVSIGGLKDRNPIACALFEVLGC